MFMGHQWCVPFILYSLISLSNTIDNWFRFRLLISLLQCI